MSSNLSFSAADSNREISGKYVEQPNRNENFMGIYKNLKYL